MIPAELQALWRLFNLISHTEPVPVDEKEKILTGYQEEYGEMATPGEGATAFEFLCNYDWKVICWDFGMSENHIGGDDVVSYVDSTIEAIKEGYEIYTWYGDDSEVLIIGIKLKDTKEKLSAVWARGKAIADQIEDKTTGEDLKTIFPVYTVQVPIFRGQLREVIDMINEHDIHEDDEFDKLTLEGVLNNPPLLKYLCEALVELDNVGGDVFDIWNQDGFCDWKDFCEFKEG